MKKRIGTVEKKRPYRKERLNEVYTKHGRYNKWKAMEKKEKMKGNRLNIK